MEGYRNDFVEQGVVGRHSGWDALDAAAAVVVANQSWQGLRFLETHGALVGAVELADTAKEIGEKSICLKYNLLKINMTLYHKNIAF